MSAGVIVMYHYIWPDDKPIPAGIRPIRASAFRRQLDWLEDRYEIVSAGTFLESIDSGCNGRAGKPPCLLSFDDGTRDQAQVVTPILAARGLSGVFFILSGPAEMQIMPLSHAVHWLLSGDENEVWELFRKQGEHLLGDAAEASRIYHYESPIRARIKYAANMALPSDVTEEIVQTALSKAGRTMGDLAAEWFVSAADIVTMNSAGMTIGIHGVTHRSLQSLGGDGMRNEIRCCADYLSKLTGKPPTWFACPFGGTGASPVDVEKMRHGMKEVGVVAAVSTQKAYVEADADRWSLPRFDTIDLR